MRANPQISQSRKCTIIIIIVVMGFADIRRNRNFGQPIGHAFDFSMSTSIALCLARELGRWCASVLWGPDYRRSEASTASWSSHLMAPPRSSDGSLGSVCCASEPRFRCTLESPTPSSFQDPLFSIGGQPRILKFLT